MFDTLDICEWPPPPDIAPPEKVIDCVEDRPVGMVEPVRWSEYLPDGLLVDLPAQPAEVASAHGRTIVVLDNTEVTDDVVRDMTEVLTSMCAQVYGRGSAARRAAAAVHAAANPPEEQSS